MVIIGRKNIEKHLNLSWPTIRRLYLRQGLPLVRMGGQWGLHSRQVKEWMEQQYEQQHRKHDTA